MSSSSFGQGPKKETIYSGPAPSTQGTVYNGPSAGGTVYNNAPVPMAYGTAAAQPAGTAAAANPYTHKAGNLLFLIAGLSVLNTVLALAHAPFAMALGLGITRVFDTVAREGNLAGAALVINLVVIGVFALIGFFARQGSRAAVLIGIILYALDTAPLFLFTPPLIISILIHGYFLFALVSSYRASRS
jgi:hypothetical protein